MLLLAPAAASADPSAWPYKQPGDSGRFDYNDFDFGGEAFGKQVDGFDACTFTDPYDINVDTYQQYQVNGCVPVATPWIKLKALQTKGWKVYCPRSAPYNWAAGTSGLGGAEQFWRTSRSVHLGDVFSEHYHPGTSDHESFNGSLRTHHWLFVIGCSPAAYKSQNVPYSNGAGPSGKPAGCCGSSSRRGVAKSRGPSLRRDLRATSYEDTREWRLNRSARRTYFAKCAPGYRVRLRKWAVGWYTAGPPRRRDGRSAESARRLRRGIAVTVRTHRLRRPGLARLQIRVGCQRLS